VTSAGVIQSRFQGWVVLGAAFVIITLSIGTLFTLGVFLTPIEASMGWGRSSIGGIGLLNWIVMGLGSFVAGHLSDRFGTRIVVLGGGALLGLGLVLSSQVGALWQFYLTFGVMVGAGVSAFYVPLTVTAMKWFETRRAMAAAIVSAGNGFGILVLSPLSRWLITAFDWRGAFLVLGDLAWLIVIPTALALKSPPAPGDRSSEGAAVGSPTSPARGPVAEVSAEQVWRSRPFWAIALTHFACCAAHSGPIFHLVAHAIDQGVATMPAATLLGFSGLSSIFGRIATGMVADRFGAKRTLLAALALQALVVFLYLFPRDLETLSALTLVFGVAYGAAMPLYPVVTREYFGERVMGRAYGGVFFISCIGMGLGSYAGGAIYDALGSYQWLFLASAAIGAMAVLVAVTLRAPVVAQTRPA